MSKRTNNRWKEITPKDKFYKLGLARPIYTKTIEGIPPLYIGFKDAGCKNCGRSYWEILILGEKYQVHGEHWEEERIKELTMKAAKLRIRLALEANRKIERLFT